jgi:hypothetical protein
MRDVNLIVIHCSASPNTRTLFTGEAGKPGFSTPAQEIDRWHRERGFSRTESWRRRQNPAITSLGYHFVIARNGALFTGRHLGEVGAHAAGWNLTSVGICMIGTDAFTAEQWKTLRETVDSLAAKFNIAKTSPGLKVIGKKGFVTSPGICGHRDLPGTAKACPGFDVKKWMAETT